MAILIAAGFALEAAIEYGAAGEAAAFVTSGLVEAGGIAGEAIGTVEAAQVSLDAATALSETESLAIASTRAAQGRVAVRGAIAGGLSKMLDTGKNKIQSVMVDGDGTALVSGYSSPDDIGKEFAGYDTTKRRRIDYEHNPNPKHQLSGLPDPPTKRRRKGDTTPHKIVTIEQYNAIQHKINPLSGNMPITRKPNGLPYTRTVVHRVSTNAILLNTASGPNTTSDFVCANALENPFSATNHTGNAMLFDQMVVQYAKYYVKKASIRVDWFNDDAVDGAVVGISLKDDTAVLTSTGQYAELGETIYRSLTPKEHTQIALSVEPPKYFGSKTPSSDDRLQVFGTGGDASDARADDSLYFHLWCCNIDYSLATQLKLRAFVTVEYEVIWSEPRALARSILT